MPQMCNMGQTALLPGFFRPKNPTASAGFEPSILGTRGQHANHQTTETAPTSGTNLHNVYLDSKRQTPISHTNVQLSLPNIEQYLSKH
jgi:hypothetical protein